MKEKKVGFRLDGKKALVTGAARGIGKAISLALAEYGSDLALIDLDREPLEKAAKEIRALGRQALPIVADVSQPEEIRKLTKEALRELGWIDILVNNAGIGVYKPAEELTVEDWDKVLSVNLKGSFFLSQMVGKHMIKRKSGKIINISSQAGVVGIEGLAAYGASKAGIILYTKVLAVEWGQYNIKVNAIAPTSIRTRQVHPGKAGEELVRKTPLGRIGEPEDVAGAALFLASEASNMISGSIIMVDGGYTAQ